MTLKIYGTLGFASTQRVLVVLNETGAAYEFRHVDFANGEHKQPWFLVMQPYGQIPVLEDGDFVLYESRAICKYIASKYASKLNRLLPSPEDIEATAIYDQAASAELFHYDKYASVIVWEKLIAPNTVISMYGILPNMDVVISARDKFAKTLDVYEAILSKHDYLTGKTNSVKQEVTLVDIFHLPFTNLLFKCHEADIITSRAHVEAWWRRISQLKSWNSVLSATDN